MVTLAALACGLAVFGLSPASAETVTIARASTSTTGGDANGASGAPVLSADGTMVAFQSAASNLVAGDRNGLDDAFVLNYATGQTQLVSVATDGGPANGPSTPLAISPDGRYVVFGSSATNLTPDALPGRCPPTMGCISQIYLRDMVAGTTDLVSRATTGAPGLLGSGAAAVSADGHFVAFTSSAPNLVPGDSNRMADVFLRDRWQGTTRRLDVTAPGSQANGPADMQQITMTPDASFVAFASAAPNLARRPFRQWNVYVANTSTHALHLISQTVTGRRPMGRSVFPSISDDGTKVAFLSSAPLGAGDGGNSWNVYLANLAAHSIRRAPLVTTAAPQISGDGDHVAVASSTVAGEMLPRGVIEAVVWNRVTGDVQLASPRLDGDSSAGQVTTVRISRDGGVTAFDSAAGDLIALDANGADDVFLHFSA